jgi:hypothetical protein
LFPFVFKLLPSKDTAFEVEATPEPLNVAWEGR